MLDDLKNVDLTWSIVNNFDPVVAKIVSPLNTEKPLAVLFPDSATLLQQDVDETFLETKTTRALASDSPTPAARPSTMPKRRVAPPVEPSQPPQ